jgi:hypothetical protein
LHHVFLKFHPTYINLSIESDKIASIDNDGNINEQTLYWKELSKFIGKPSVEDFETAIINLTELFKKLKFLHKLTITNQNKQINFVFLFRSFFYQIHTDNVGNHFCNNNPVLDGVFR